LRSVIEAAKAAQRNDLATALEELCEMVGLASIKAEFAVLGSFCLEFAGKQDSLQEKKDFKITLSGPPGVGKSKFGRIFAKIVSAAGTVVSGAGEATAVTSANRRGDYVGQTEPNMVALMTMLFPCVSLEGADLVVCGFNFNEYTTAELSQLFKRHANKKGWELDEACTEDAITQELDKQDLTMLCECLIKTMVGECISAQQIGEEGHLEKKQTLQLKHVILGVLQALKFGIITKQEIDDDKAAASLVPVETFESLFGVNRACSKFVGQKDLLADLKRVIDVHGHPEENTTLDGPGPLCILFDGPPGLGKTELAGLLAEVLFEMPLSELEKSDRFLAFNCAQFRSEQSSNILFGSTPGHEGGPGRLYPLIKNCATAVVLFDEFEKMHATVVETILKITDTQGTVSSNQGQRQPLSMSRATFIFTTNMHSHIKFKKGLSVAENVKDIFGAPLRSRIGDGALRFKELIPSEFIEIVHRALLKLRLEILKKSKTTVRWTTEVPIVLARNLTSRHNAGEAIDLRYELNEGIKRVYQKIVHSGPNSLPMGVKFKPLDTGGEVTLYVDKDSAVRFMAKGMVRSLRTCEDEHGDVGTCGSCGRGASLAQVSCRHQQATGAASALIATVKTTIEGVNAEAKVTTREAVRKAVEGTKAEAELVKNEAVQKAVEAARGEMLAFQCIVAVLVVSVRWW
jgi:DNA polymerase III delta prime subunit